LSKRGRASRVPLIRGKQFPRKTEGRFEGEAQQKSGREAREKSQPRAVFFLQVPGVTGAADRRFLGAGKRRGGVMS